MIFQCLEHCEEIRREQVNAQSITAAIGWSGLFNGFGGENSEKSEPKDLLPFRLDKDGETKSDYFSPKTIAVVRALARANRIPDKVLLILQQFKEFKL